MREKLFKVSFFMEFLRKNYQVSKAFNSNFMKILNSPVFLRTSASFLPQSQFFIENFIAHEGFITNFRLIFDLNFIRVI